MRSNLRGALVALAVCALPVAAHAQAPIKLAYVDVATIMDQVPGRSEAQQQFEREASGIRAELQRLQDSSQTLIGAYQKAQPTLTPAQRTTRENELKAKLGDYQQRAQALQERGARREQEFASQFETVVRQAIDDVRTSDGYAMVFAAGANSAMLSGDKSLDVTDKVLARLRTIAGTRGAAPTTTRPAAAPTTGAPVAVPAGAARPQSPPQN